MESKPQQLSSRGVRLRHLTRSSLTGHCTRCTSLLATLEPLTAARFPSRDFAMPLQTSSVLTLPAELLRRIVDMAIDDGRWEDLTTLFSILRACRVFYDVAAPLYWRVSSRPSVSRPLLASEAS